jgi:RNA polymerase sigma-70 factor, ECF subfamily
MTASLSVAAAPAGEAVRGTAVTAVRAHRPGSAAQTMADLHRLHGRELLNFLVRLCLGDRQHAEDLLQETMLRAWRHQEDISSTAPDSMRPWLFTIGRRLAIDAHRARKSRPLEAMDAFAATELDRESLEDPIERAVIAFDVRKALSGLSREHRQVLIEVFLHDRTLQEAAEVLRIPVGTAKSRTHHGLRALRRALAEWSRQPPAHSEQPT